MEDFTKMNALNWIDTITDHYHVETELIKNKNHFTTYEYHITDPQKKALGFRIFLNDRKELSSFTTDMFDFEWFNIAEGIEENQIIHAAQCCLDGNLLFRKSLTGKILLEFDTTKGKSRSGMKVSRESLEDFQRGYTRK